MNNFSDANFEAFVDRYERETESFRQVLDSRTEEQLKRDEYVLDQHSRGKRMKVVLRKASKKSTGMLRNLNRVNQFGTFLNSFKTFIMLINLYNYKNIAKGSEKNICSV